MTQISLSRNTSTILSALKVYLQQEYSGQLFRIVLFGSQARGNATDLSDIDVLVVLNDPVNASAEIKRTSQFIAQLCLEHNVLISRLFLGRSRFENENSPLLRNIRSEGLVL